MISISKATSLAESSVRRAFAVCDAEIAAAKAGYSPIRKGGTPAERIAAAIGAISQSPVADHAQIVRRLNKTIDEALAPLNEVIEQATEMAAVVKYLRGETADLAIEDASLFAAARSVREAHLGGLIDGMATARAIERRIDDIHAEIKRLENNYLPQVRSAAGVVSAKGMAAMARSAGLPNAEHYERRAKRLIGVHRWRHGDGAPRRSKKGGLR